MERWLHQHIFKVGWLLTKQHRTTTTLYYTFFLPGVLLKAVVYWLVAGFLNVRAERGIAWPEAQAIGELRLNFVRLARNTNRFKLAIISTVPLIAGLVCLWLITNNVLGLQEFVVMARAGGLSNLPRALQVLTATPDFWLWFYIAFTIANTMMPNVADLKGWAWAVGALIVAVLLLVIIGAGDELIGGALAGPITNGLQTLAGLFVMTIGIDLVVVAVLGAIESLIERVTGDSATFRNGKLITMTRADLRAQREQEAEKRARQRQRQAEKIAGPPSIYRLPLPIPDPPTRETAREPITVRREETMPLPIGAAPVPRPELPADTSDTAAPEPKAMPTPLTAATSIPAARTAPPVSARPAIPTPTERPEPSRPPERPAIPTPTERAATPPGSDRHALPRTPFGSTPPGDRPSAPRSPFGTPPNDRPAMPAAERPALPKNPLPVRPMPVPKPAPARPVEDDDQSDDDEIVRVPLDELLGEADEDIIREPVEETPPWLADILANAGEDADSEDDSDDDDVRYVPAEDIP